MTITEFLLARIAEDEADLKEPTNADYCDDLSGRHYTNERIRSECAAKRAIIDLHSGENDTRCQSWNGNFVEGPCETVRALAAVYSEHPDYQQEWASD